MLIGSHKLSASAVLDISMGRRTKVPTRTAEGRTFVRAPGTPLPKALQMQTAAGRGDAKSLAKSAATVWYAEGRALVRAPGTLNPLPKALHHICILDYIEIDWFYLVFGVNVLLKFLKFHVLLGHICSIVLIFLQYPLFLECKLR